MPRLPIPGEDAGEWGELLNGFLRVEHADDGSLKKAAQFALAADLATKYERPPAGIPLSHLDPGSASAGQVLKYDGSALVWDAAALGGMIPSTASLLKGDGAGGAVAAVAGSDYAAASHSHAVADISGLQAQLDTKAAVSHAHSASNLTSGTLPLERGGTGGTDAASARTNLGLGDCATLDVGSGAGTVAAGDHLHAGTYQPAGDYLTPSSALDGSKVSGTVAEADHATSANEAEGLGDETLEIYHDGDGWTSAGPITASAFVGNLIGTASTAPWSGITGKPTTVAGFGITDALTSVSPNIPRLNAANVFVLSDLARNANDVSVAPYAAISTAAANWGLGTAATTRDSLFIGQQFRIRQSGTVTRARLYVADTTNLTTLTVTYWRRLSANLDKKVGETANLVSSITGGQTNTVTVSVPGIQQGDYYGLHAVWSGAGTNLTALSTQSETTEYTLNDGSPTAAGYAWESQTAVAGSAVPVESQMQAPVMVAIGDSICEGISASYGYLLGRALSAQQANDPSFSTPWKVADALGVGSWQNMGITGDHIAAIAARIGTDCVDLHPRIALLEGGINSLAATDAAWLADWATILEAVTGAGIRPIVLLMTPSTALGEANWQAKNDALAALCAAEYPTAVVVDSSPYVGLFRSGGAAGNLWDIQPQYNLDGVHFNAAGYAAIARAVADTVMGISVGGSLTAGSAHLRGGLTLDADAPRSILMGRPAISDLAGRDLTIRAGGPTQGMTNAAGGTLRLRGGPTTGTGAARVALEVPIVGSSGTAENATYAEIALVTANGLSVTTATSTVPLNVTTGGSGAIAITNTTTGGSALHRATLSTATPVIAEFGAEPGYATLATTSDHPIVLKIASVEGARLHSNRFFGVGTPAPVTPLHAIRLDAGTTTVARSLTLGHASAGTPAAGFGTGIGFSLHLPDGSTNDVAYIDGVNPNAYRSGDIRFSVSQGSAPVEAMRINYLGRVGIGKTNPATPLDVNGTISASALKLTTGAGAGKLLASDAAGLLTLTDPAAIDYTALLDCADDAAAATAGVAVGRLYRTGNAVMVRLS